MKKAILFLTTFFISISITMGQITIGSGIAPESGALLDLKEKAVNNPDANTIQSLENSAKGLLYPKVSLKAWNQLTPLYGGKDNGNGNWSDEATTRDKLLATGMVVYNVNPDASQMEEGLYMWRVDEWIKISGCIGKALFDPVDCSDIQSAGNFIERKNLTGSECLTIKVNVRKTGPFVISGTTGNGYSFYLAGAALNTGPLLLTIPGQGIPVNKGIDKLALKGIDLASGCNPEIKVSSSIADYSINCSSITVQGQYLKGTALTAQNTIIVSVNAASTGSYMISTPLVNGVSFSGSGEFTTTGTKQVVLIGTGTPTVNVDFPLQVNTNSSQGNTSCFAAIPITLPEMTYAIIGRNVWSWAAAPRVAALTNGQSFGPNGTVKMLKLEQLWSTEKITDAVTNLNFGLGSKTEYPDIVLYFAYDASPTAELSIALHDYINKGGCVIYGSSDKTASQVNILLSGLFGIQTAQSQIAGAGTTDDNTYMIANLPGDPVINGPFGNLAGKYWGEDNASAGSVILSSLPPNSIQVCSANNPFGKMEVNPDYSIIWYNDSKNFFYFGDSVGTEFNNTSQNDYPASYSTTGIPLSKLYGNYPQPAGSPSQYVYNAALELNAVAWMIKKAAVSGINPH
jgi:hypothetical protein